MAFEGLRHDMKMTRVFYHPSFMPARKFVNTLNSQKYFMLFADWLIGPSLLMH